MLEIDMLFFDFDGTLTNSLPPAIEAMQEMLKELGLPHKSAEEIKQHIGYGERPFVSGSIGSEDEEKIEIAKQAYYRIYTEKLKEIKLFPHIKEVLMHFKNKVKVIVSNKRDKFIKLILDLHSLSGQFTEVLGEDSIEIHKPDPSSITALLKKHKIPPERALFIGDMTVDIETGKNAGTHTCGVTYGFHGREKLEKAQPDFLIDDFLKLRELIA
jgi:phosphoglycolate phosphatase